MISATRPAMQQVPLQEQDNNDLLHKLYILKMLPNIYPFLSEQDSSSIPLVCKKWKKLDQLILQSCILPKHDPNISWRTHYYALERFHLKLKRKYWFRDEELDSRNTGQKTLCSLHISTNHPTGCYILNHFNSSYSEVNIFDANNGKWIRNYDNVYGDVKNITFNYPYLVSYHKEQLSFIDVRAKPNDSPTYYSVGADTLNQPSINQYGFCALLNLGQKQALTFYQIDGIGLLHKGKEFANFNGCTYLLHNHTLLYPQGPNVLIMYDISNPQIVPITTIIWPESERHSPQEPILSMVANGTTLATLSDNWISICDLPSAQVLKQLSRPETCLTIECLSQGTLFITTTQQKKYRWHTETIKQVEALTFGGTVVTKWDVHRNLPPNETLPIAKVAGEKLFSWKNSGGPLSGTKCDFVYYDLT